MARLWPRIRDRLPTIDLYRERARRTIPVVRLGLEAQAIDLSADT